MTRPCGVFEWALHRWANGRRSRLLLAPTSVNHTALLPPQTGLRVNLCDQCHVPAGPP